MTTVEISFSTNKQPFLTSNLLCRLTKMLPEVTRDKSLGTRILAMTVMLFASNFSVSSSDSCMEGGRDGGRRGREKEEGMEGGRK